MWMAEKKDQQTASGSMTYPKKGTFNRLVFKFPLVLWRMGLGSVLSNPARGGRKMLVLTTWGRKSKQARHTMLSYVLAQDREYVCSGWGVKTDWYKNIQANPLVRIQAWQKNFAANAHRVEDLDKYTAIVQDLFETGGDSHFEAWLDSFGISYSQEDMIYKRDRLVLVAFDPCDEPGPPPLQPDLVWVWLVAIGLLGILLWLLL
jgi:deazaflavin-dependent oxidoreductase (nitroreductase family)